MDKYNDFSNAVRRLDEVLKIDKNTVTRDSAIKRFELCYDLAWKCIKEYAKDQGLECYSPRECFKIAFQLKLIDQNEKWFEMINARNESVHIYNEQGADNLYNELPDYLDILRVLETKLSESI